MSFLEGSYDEEERGLHGFWRIGADYLFLV